MTIITKGMGAIIKHLGKKRTSFASKIKKEKIKKLKIKAAAVVAGGTVAAAGAGAAGSYMASKAQRKK